VCPHAAVERTLPADEITGNSLRCFVACACGALDVVRVVHLSGHVDEFSGPVAAAAVLAEHPNHTLTTAWSPSGCASKKLVIVAPDSELKHGRIYFLIPSDTLPADRRTKQQISSNSKKSAKRSSSGDTTRQDNYLRKLITKTPSSQGRSYIVARCTNGNFKMVGSQWQPVFFWSAPPSAVVRFISPPLRRAGTNTGDGRTAPGSVCGGRRSRASWRRPRIERAPLVFFPMHILSVFFLICRCEYHENVFLTSGSPDDTVSRCPGLNERSLAREIGTK
jgi:hypothetical protein